MTNDIFTIGHSTHSIDVFVSLLRGHRIDVLADVRSSPFSRFNPQFNRDELKYALRGAGIRYVFLGKELGARSDDPSCYVHNKVQYDRLARSPLFRLGLDRVTKGTEKYRVVLMCAEKDPLDCHRTILVARHLVSRGHNVNHILSDGELEPHSALQRRLLSQLGMSSTDMFLSFEEILDEAYKRQGERIAHESYVTRNKDDEPVVKSLRVGKPK